MGLVLYTIPPTTNFSRNPIRFKVGTDTPITTAGLYIQCRISFGTMGSAITEVIRVPLTPDAQGLAEVDLQRIVDRLMDLKLPTIAGTVQKIATHSGTLQVSFVEYSIDAPTGGTPVDAGSFTIIKGGIAYERWTGQAWFANWYTTPRRFLSWFKLERSISTWQHLWLSYLHLPGDDTNYAVKTTVHFTDGTNSAGPTINFPDTSQVKSGYVYHIPVGYTQLDIGAVNTAKRVHYYTVGVYKNTTLVSEQITCLMDYTPDYEQLQFVFFNSLGGLDTIRLKGEHQQQLNRDFDLVDINTSRSNLSAYVLPAQSQQNQVIEGRSFKGNIGFTDDIDLQDLRRELFLSQAIYVPKATRWWPVNVLDTSVDMGKLNDQLREIGIEWSFAWANENYTPEWNDLGSEPAPTLVCPTGTITKTAYTGRISFSHAPGPVDQYRIGLYKTSDNSQVGEIVTYSIPFGSSISALWDYLDPSTAYYFKIFMDVTSTGYTQECTGYTFTTDAAGVAPPPSTGLMQVVMSSGLGYSQALFSINSPTASITLTPPAGFNLTKFNTPANGTHPEGTFSISISYMGMLNNTISITDANGITQSAVVSYSGTVTFTGVVINSSVTTVINVS